jgi:hypothetical protein
MTAKQLITEIFSRPQNGVSPDMRRLTARQFIWLRDLIMSEVGSRRAEAGIVHKGDGGSLVWTPAGPNKYVLSEDQAGAKHSLMRLANLGTQGAGSLFPGGEA